MREAVTRLAPGARLPPPGADGETELSAGGAWAPLTAPWLVYVDEARARFALDEMVRARRADPSDLAVVGFARAPDAFGASTPAGERLVAALREP